MEMLFTYEALHSHPRTKPNVFVYWKLTEKNNHGNVEQYGKHLTTPFPICWPHGFGCELFGKTWEGMGCHICMNAYWWIGEIKDCEMILAQTMACTSDSMFAPSQWETVLLWNNVSRLLGASIESTLDSRIGISLSFTVQHWCHMATHILVSIVQMKACCLFGAKPWPEQYPLVKFKLNWNITITKNDG